jgi:tetratricopeptide (TPR) repeat protein
MIKKIYFLIILITQISFAQKDGYWDNERATNKEITLEAGKRILVKTQDLPIGTTEFVYRISVLSEGEKLSNSLVSILKMIPDPSGYSQGAAGVIHLSTVLSGEDLCKYAVFSNAKNANEYQKDGKTYEACLVQNKKVNKDAQLVSSSSTCLINIPFLWFGFESQNWVMNQKIVLEVVPWIDLKASKGWTKDAKEEVLKLANKNIDINFLSEKENYLATFLELLTLKYKYQEFNQLLAIEKNKIIADISDEGIKKSGKQDEYLKNFNQSIKKLAETNQEEAISKLNQLITIRKLGRANEYDLLGMLYLQTKQFQKAEEWMDKAIIADKNNITFQLHKAHFYLFTDEVSKAKDIHKKYRNQNINSKLSWKDATIKEFENFKKLGLPDDSFNKIIRVLD